MMEQTGVPDGRSFIPDERNSVRTREEGGGVTRWTVVAVAVHGGRGVLVAGVLLDDEGGRLCRTDLGQKRPVAGSQGGRGRRDLEPDEEATAVEGKRRRDHRWWWRDVKKKEVLVAGCCRGGWRRQQQAGCSTRTTGMPADRKRRQGASARDRRDRRDLHEEERTDRGQ